MADEILLKALQEKDEKSWNSYFSNIKNAEIDLSNAEINFPPNFKQFSLINIYSIDFSNSVISGTPDFNANHKNARIKLICYKTIFIDNVTLCRLRDDSKFKNTCFKSRVNFLADLIKVELNFCEFVEDFVLSSHTIRDCKIKNTTFQKQVNFNHSKIFNSHYVNNITRGRFSCRDARLTNIDLSKSEYEDIVNFGNSTIIGKVSFKGSKFKWAPKFFETKFSNEFDITLCRFKDTTSPHAYDSYRHLKYLMQEKGAHYEANKFFALEQAALLRKNFDLRRNFWDTCLLSLNHISNYHNQSWSRGIAFTLLVGIIFFIPYLISLGELTQPYTQSIFCNFKYFWQFIIPTHKMDFINGQLNFLSSMIDFIGRIFIGYGIYQTVQAFRKQGRK